MDFTWVEFTILNFCHRFGRVDVFQEHLDSVSVTQRAIAELAPLDDLPRECLSSMIRGNFKLKPGRAVHGNNTPVNVPAPTLRLIRFNSGCM